MKQKQNLKYVIKRDGRKVEFEPMKIYSAIEKAFKEVEKENYDEFAFMNIIEKITNDVEKQLKNKITVEEIQDIVEKELMNSDRKDVAKAYILYRNARTMARGNITDKDIIELIHGTNKYWASENSNKDAKVVTVQRDYLAGITSTDIARRFLLPKEVCKAHDEGIIHQHDMDYMAQSALNNCGLVNLEDMLNYGTVINGVAIDPQKRLLTAVTVSTQIITAVSSSQYGK